MKHGIEINPWGTLYVSNRDLPSQFKKHIGLLGKHVCPQKYKALDRLNHKRLFVSLLNSRVQCISLIWILVLYSPPASNMYNNNKKIMGSVQFTKFSSHCD